MIALKGKGRAQQEGGGYHSNPGLQFKHANIFDLTLEDRPDGSHKGGRSNQQNAGQKAEHGRIKAHNHHTREGERNAQPTPPVNLLLQEEDRHDSGNGNAQLGDNGNHRSVCRCKPQKEKTKPKGSRAQRNDDDIPHTALKNPQERKQHDHDQRKANTRKQERWKMLKAHLPGNQSKAPDEVDQNHESGVFTGHREATRVDLAKAPQDRSCAGLREDRLALVFLIFLSTRCSILTSYRFRSFAIRS